MLQQLIQIDVIFSLSGKCPDLVLQREVVGMRSLPEHPYHRVLHARLDEGRLQHFPGDGLGFDEVVAILGTSLVDALDFAQQVWVQHEVVRGFADLALLYHGLVDGVDGGLLGTCKVGEELLNVNPAYLFGHLAVLNVEDDFLDGNGAPYFGVLDGGLVYELQIRVVILHLVQKRREVDHLVPEGVKSGKYGLEFLPVFRSEHAPLINEVLLGVVEGGDVGPVYIEEVEKLKQGEFVL